MEHPESEEVQRLKKPTVIFQDEASMEDDEFGYAVRGQMSTIAAAVPASGREEMASGRQRTGNRGVRRLRASTTIRRRGAVQRVRSPAGIKEREERCRMRSVCAVACSFCLFYSKSRPTDTHKRSDASLKRSIDASASSA